MSGLTKMFDCRSRRSRRRDKARWHRWSRRKWIHIQCSCGRAQEGRSIEERGVVTFFSLWDRFSAALITFSHSCFFMFDHLSHYVPYVGYASCLYRYAPHHTAIRMPTCVTGGIIPQAAKPSINGKVTDFSLLCRGAIPHRTGLWW